MFFRLLRPLWFALDPERAHRLAMLLMKVAERAARAGRAAAPEVPALGQVLWGLRFPNPVGLAAGFDKNAEAPHGWALLGFGFAELGTITWDPQPGNAPPRLFRLPAERALVNRLGFNNDGAAAIAARLQRRWRRPAIPIGINIGKSMRVSLDGAPADYARALESLFPFADYVAVNVSSPNTPGLRDLQAEARLRLLLEFLAETNTGLAARRGERPRPLLVKIAPDLSDEAVVAIVETARRAGAAGIIATNTTVARAAPIGRGVPAGGLSGAPLRERSTHVVRIAYRASGGALPVIGVGGIFSAADAWEKIGAGASLVELYTGLVYEGPFLARRIVEGLAERVRRAGLAHLREHVGSEHAR